MTKFDDNQIDLDAFFSKTRNSAPAPSKDVMMRILEDAYSQQNIQVNTPNRNRFKPSGFWDSARDMLGGWIPVSGLVASTCFGVFIGAFGDFNAFDQLGSGQILTFWETPAQFDQEDEIIDPFMGLNSLIFEG